MRILPSLVGRHERSVIQARVKHLQPRLVRKVTRSDRTQHLIIPRFLSTIRNLRKIPVRDLAFLGIASHLN